MKNKKWKRKAKRLYGYCCSIKCPQCKYYKIVNCTPYEVDFDCCAPCYLPGNTDIRILEKEFYKSPLKHV